MPQISGCMIRSSTSPWPKRCRVFNFRSLAQARSSGTCSSTRGPDQTKAIVGTTSGAPAPHRGGTMKLIGVDVGGTFTDIVFTDTETGRTIIHKAPTTPDDPSHGVITGVGELC